MSGVSDLRPEQLAALPRHGGDLEFASETWGVATETWLDLSTGINPQPYPVGQVPGRVWQDLPYRDYGLSAAAQGYYGQRPNLVTPGSQMAIESLPQSLPKASVALPDLGYNEYAKAWREAGHELLFYANYRDLKQLLGQKHAQHCVIINPNNPSGLEFSRAEIMALAALSEGFCLVDEAFRDLKPEASLLPFDTQQSSRLIVLRSLGKFFGLAGARLGFVFMGSQAQAKLLAPLQRSLCLWSLPGPSLWGATQALNDLPWQQQNRLEIARQSQNLHTLLARYLEADWHNRGLFLSAFFNAQTGFAIYQGLAQKGILIRYFHLPKARCLLRFGLPNGEGLVRLEQVLAAWR